MDKKKKRKDVIPFPRPKELPAGSTTDGREKAEPKSREGRFDAAKRRIRHKILHGNLLE